MPLVQSTRLPVGAKFSMARADRVVNFIEQACVHTKSPYAHSTTKKCTYRKLGEQAHCYKKHFVLEDWQKGSATKVGDEWNLSGIIRPLFGAVRWSPSDKQWVRQYNIAWLEMARKNGKSELMAALGLYLLIHDGEEGAEIYGAASDRDQASQVFDVARDMIHLSPVLSKLKDRGDLEIIDSRKRIVYTPTRSVYRVIAADAMGNLGANPHGILFDEVLAQPNDHLWNYLKQGFGTRLQPMMIGVTTAGPSRDTFAYGEHEFAIKFANEPMMAPNRFAFMAFMDEKDDWRDETKWPEANPGLATETKPGFLKIEHLRNELSEAINKGDLSAVSHFKIFRLNQWGISSNLWLDMEVWRDSEATAGSFTEEDMKGIKCYGGFDLAETMDFTAWVVVAKSATGRLMIKPRFYLTKQALQTRHKRRQDKVLSWIDEGYVTLFNSDVQDYDKIRDDMLADIGEYGIKMFGYDPHQAPAIVNFLENRSSAVGVKVPQVTTRMDAPAKELTRILGQRQLTSNSNPVLEWNANNAGYKSDSEGHIKPHKENSTGNIDGITAVVNALFCIVSVVDDEGDFFFFDDDETSDGEEW